MTPEHGNPAESNLSIPPVFRALQGIEAIPNELSLRRLLVSEGYCRIEDPTVTLELYGGLRVKTGCKVLPLHANTIAAAISILCRLYPKARAMLPNDEELGKFYRFSINGGLITSDPLHRLEQEDHLICFNASVGG